MIKPLRFVLSISFVTTMLKKLRQNYLKLTLFTMAAILSQSAHANIQTIEVVKNNSTTITVPEKIKTMIIGNPAIAKTIVLKPDSLLINGTAFGSTSLTLFGKSGASYEYKIQVTHDLNILRSHINKIDSRIKVNSDTNGDSIILSGTAANTELIDRAEEAAIRYFGIYESTLKYATQPRERTENLNPEGKPADYLPKTNKTPGQFANAYGRTGEIKANTTRVVNLIVSEDKLLSAPLRLQVLLNKIDNRILVEEVNGVMMLKGHVKTPAALARALSTADRFIAGGLIPPDFSVISDQGGVLAGNTDETQYVTPTFGGNTGGQGNQGRRGNNNNNNGGGNGGGAGGGGAGGGGGNSRGNSGGNIGNQSVTALPIANAKGNLAQNIARGDVVMAANGRVMSTIRVDKNPRIEIQMRIVGVDRSKTEEFGIDWSLVSTNINGNKATSVQLGSFLGEVNGNPFGIGDGDSIDAGSSALTFGLNQLKGNKTLSLLSFIRWIQSNGSGKTLTEPLLTALSGESASFNVGGTIPVLTQDTTTFANATTTQNIQQTVTFLQYGLGIVVRPTLLENGKISIVLDQTLSEPDYTVAAPTSSSSSIPGFTTRTVNTITETSDGETWAVAGLLNEQDTQKVDSIPYLSNLPVIGWLFKKENKGKSRKELLLVVTARLVGDEEAQPSQNAENNITTEQLNQVTKQNKPEAPKQPSASSNAQSILQKQPNYIKPAKAKTIPTAESIP